MNPCNLVCDGIADAEARQPLPVAGRCRFRGRFAPARPVAPASTMTVADVLGDDMPANNRAHYGGDYNRRAALVRAAAYANPATLCRRCGLTLEQVRRRNPKATWDAGHVVDGLVDGPLAAECSPCNRSAGAIRRNNMIAEPTSRQW